MSSGSRFFFPFHLPYGGTILTTCPGLLFYFGKPLNCCSNLLFSNFCLSSTDASHVTGTGWFASGSRRASTDNLGSNPFSLFPFRQVSLYVLSLFPPPPGFFTFQFHCNGVPNSSGNEFVPGIIGTLFPLFTAPLVRVCPLFLFASSFWSASPFGRIRKLTCNRSFLSLGLVSVWDASLTTHPCSSAPAPHATVSF